MKIILRNKENVYEQIVNEYKRYISLNILRNGDKLPSCRQLATELGINPNTVARAYSVLEQDGFIKAFPKKGVYVSFEENPSLLLEKEIQTYLEEIKDKISYEDLMNVIKKVYGGEANDRD